MTSFHSPVHNLRCYYVFPGPQIRCQVDRFITPVTDIGKLWAITNLYPVHIQAVPVIAADMHYEFIRFCVQAEGIAEMDECVRRLINIRVT